MKAEVAADIRTIFNAPDRTTAEAYLVEPFASMPKSPRNWLTGWREHPRRPDRLCLPRAHQRRLRTTNVVERLSREILRRSSVVSIFPNEASCLRLVSAVLVELDEEWQVHGRMYLRSRRRIAAIVVVAVVEKWENLAFPLFHNRLQLLRFEGYQTEITEFSLRYLDFLGLSVLTNNVNLPIVLNGQAQFQDMTNAAFVYPYPPPDDGGISNNPSSSLDSNPYPNPYP